MDYIAYCHRIVKLLVDTESQITYGGHTSITVEHLLRLLHGDSDITGWDDPEALDVQAFRGALEEMIQRQYILGRFKVFQVSSTPEGRAFAKDPISSWVEICSRTLDSNCERLLQEVNRLSESQNDLFVLRRWVGYDQLIQVLGMLLNLDSLSRLDGLVRSLYAEDLLAFSGSPDRGKSSVCASYNGLVWTSRRDLILHWTELDWLVSEWETSNVDFKRELILKTQDQKAEFVKDILGLANTQSTGKRWMVVGFDDKMREQYVPVNPIESEDFQSRLSSLKEERLQQILSSYTDPPVQIKLKHLPYRRGPVVLIEVHRDARLVPYQVSKELRGAQRPLRPGDLFVRHGSITEPPTPRELQALQAEATWADRGQVSDPSTVERCEVGL